MSYFLNMLTCHIFGHFFKITHIHVSQNLKSWFEEHAAQHFGGDIQTFSSKLPGFIWAKYKVEKHFPSYICLGPSTRFDVRTDENNNPKPGQEPINAIE